MKDRKAILENIKSTRMARQSPNRSYSEKPPAIKNEDAIRKRHVFDAYITWYSIPAVIKTMKKEDRFKMNLNSYAEELIEIKSKTDFSKRFKVDLDTLKNWERTTKWKEVDNAMKGWLKMLTSNVRTKLYQSIMKDGKAPEIKLFEQIVNDFSERSSVNMEAEVYTLDGDRLAEIKEKFRKNAHRRGKR